MFSDCDDDFCIFVCGTCRRYFTQLSAFSQHKKERCQTKKSSNDMLLNDATGELTHKHGNENGQLESLTNCNAETFNDFEDGSQRKYPRKQDKKLIKRTIRELEDEKLLSPEGKVNVDSLLSPSSLNETPPQAAHALATAELQRTCKHPVYTCKTCGAEFPNTNGRVFKCVDCRRGFYTEADLNQHMVRAKHNNLCAVCGKIFPDKYKLRKHELSHVTEKNFRCEEPGCTKSFKSAEDVRTHVRYVHAAEKRFHCTRCSRAFTRLDKFKLHMNTHGIVMKPGPVSPTSDVLKPPGSGFLALKSPPEDETSETAVVPSHLSPNDVVPGVIATPGLVGNLETDCRRPPSYDPNTSTSPEGDRTEDSEHGKDRLSMVSLAQSTDSVNIPGAASGGPVDPGDDLQSQSGQRCEKCNGRYQTSMEFLAHEERRADHVLRCERCSGKFLSPCELRSHVRAHHGDDESLPPAPALPPSHVQMSKQRQHQPQAFLCKIQPPPENALLWILGPLPFAAHKCTDMQAPLK